MKALVIQSFIIFKGLLVTFMLAVRQGSKMGEVALGLGARVILSFVWPLSVQFLSVARLFPP